MKQQVCTGVHRTIGQLGGSSGLKWVHLCDLGVSLLVLVGFYHVFVGLVAESDLRW